MAASSVATLVQMVAAGRGVTLLPETAVALEARAGSGITTVARRDAPSRTLALAWRASSPRSARDRDLVDLLRLPSHTTPRRRPSASGETVPAWILVG